MDFSFLPPFFSLFEPRTTLSSPLVTLLSSLPPTSFCTDILETTLHHYSIHFVFSHPFFLIYHFLYDFSSLSVCLVLVSSYTSLSLSHSLLLYICSFLPSLHFSPERAQIFEEFRTAREYVSSGNPLVPVPLPLSFSSTLHFLDGWVSGNRYCSSRM